MGLLDMSWGSPKFETIINNGNPHKRLDIAIIGDGYTSSQQAQFRQDVNKIIDAFRNTEPIQTYFNHFNFHRINVFSAESGTDDSYATPPITRKTALDTGFSPVEGIIQGSGVRARRLVGPSAWVMSVATLSGAPWDYIIVVVNYPVYGGASDPLMLVAYTSNGPTNFPQIAVHEAGHSIAKLMDEYTGDLPDIDFVQGWTLPSILPWPNVDTNGANPKWRPWISAGTPLPTPAIAANADRIGAFEGAANMTNGVYRPKQQCLMRNSNHQFCEVCTEQWIKVIYQKSNIVDSFTPAFNPPIPLMFSGTQNITFRARVVRPNNIHTTWRTKKLEDTRWQTRQRTDNYANFQVALPASNVLGTYWLVEVALEDRSPMIRTNAIKAQAKQTYTWHVITN